jgi:hypothetical protein
MSWVILDGELDRHLKSTLCKEEEEIAAVKRRKYFFFI